MLAFHVRDGATFRYRARFGTYRYANISFYDSEGEEILFHLSLRPDEGLAVCNRRGPDPGAWAREIPRRAALSGEGAEVEIRFAPPKVTVWIDGTEIFRFGGMRRRFPGLERIAQADYQGGIATGAIEIRLPGATPELTADGLALSDRMVLHGRHTGPDRDAAFALEVPGLDSPPEVIARPVPRGGGWRITLEAMLPGRAWQAVAGDAPLVVRVRRHDGGAWSDEIRLTRSEAAERIGALLTRADLRADPGAAMQALEHVRFGGLGPLLPAPARAALAELAQFYRLEGFLPEAAAGAAVPPPGGSGTDRRRVAIAGAQARVSEALREDPGVDAVALIRQQDLDRADQRELLLALSETLCARGEIGRAHAWAEAEGLPDIAPVGDLWRDSAMLPFLCLSRRFDTLTGTLRELVALREGWLVTPALAWTLRHVLEETGLDEADRERVFRAYAALVSSRTDSYWERSPCQALVAASVELVVRRDRLPDAAQERVIRFVLQTHGLSRAFWDGIAAAIEAGRLALPAELRRARAAFGELLGAGDPEALSGALALFERAGNPEAPRWRHELLGPGGLDGPEHAPDPEALVAAGLDPGEAALRHLAHPGAAPGGPALAAAAAEALPARYENVPRAPYYGLQLRASRRTAGLFARLAAGGTPPGTPEIDALAGDLMILAGRRSRYLGFGLAVALLHGLLRLDELDAAERLYGHVAQRQAALSEDERGRLAEAPALTMALHALRATETAGGHALARRVMALFAEAAAALPSPVAPPPWPDPFVSPIFDTVVCVFSCRANLDSRIPAMREGWLGLLRQVGVPYVVIVGDGDGRHEDDVVHLDAPDDYEGLPQKTLAAIRWVHDRTAFTHMVKVDDDCFIDPAEFFHSQSYRKFDYYGRPLTRRPGQMDRAWHCGKSGSARGRLELDKSPEPSTYADGGSGYALSRTAMAAALEAADSPEGRQLIQVSFMEDKLLGDLLALRDIRVADEDYRISIRRRTGGAAQPVSLWVNGFDASRAAPVKLVHLDGGGDQAAARDALERETLTPKKIWPSFQRVTLGYQSNAMELVSPPDRLEAARAAEVAVVACLRNEMFMLPHFLAHYRRLGVGAFLIADNCSDDGTLDYLAAQPDVALFSVDTDYARSSYGVAWQQALLSNFRRDRWSLVADADELMVWDPALGATLPDLVAGPDFAGAEAARVFMLDMYPGGPLEAADFSGGDPFAEAGYVDRAPFLTNWAGRGPYSNMPTWTSALRHRLIPGSRADLFVAQKIALLRYQPWMRLSAGMHFVADVTLARRELLFAHFKYNADFRRKAREEVARRQHFNDAEEYRKYLALVSEGRDAIYDPAVSVPWRDSPFVAARLSPETAGEGAA
ncbi:Galactosyltransferase [Tranquillimonas rosea]|uniref:Galactosyltransferase n=1 Tax=Tranquillimonas rosea TaxID=641238 RepID=A0A1H9WZW2_9RHOB|nr:glycosyltransferase family 2 protein [Tranquillimonas rosea]SES39207.1 Galactosyltransferase [Tranquillimonas rosea]